MVPLSEDRENAAQALASDVTTVTEERRRPGRLEHITPTLIPLMCSATIRMNVRDNLGEW
jgi:hypothetical protein